VDGLFIQDINELLEFNSKKIDKINILRGGYFYGNKLFNGVISFTTKNLDYESKLKGDFIIKPEVLRPIPTKKYYNPNYDNKISTRIPDYRYQLLWLPELKLKESETDLSFFTSDINGTFEIILDGFTANGDPINIIETFEVK
jgi:hypothetical protein